ncbi:GNAT family N-acetyltransferase [Reinekea marina]|uniref:GNAT family N-acetyltransferase n=1 Tax=Reinekea marina TaxID=1310421 RepID=A0ABV7WU64_9GAMM|nr:GNAT family N-acetyltransferase [Reinekea marina]MDN3650812.1 GNAT family N-acetyltransferase [Reinekea marina]
MFRIREAVEKDANEACAVLIRSIKEVCAKDYPNEEFVAEWLENKTPENIKLWINNPETYEVVCVDEDDKVVGFSAVTLSGEILLNYLLPEALYKNSGKAMLAALEKRVIQNGVENIRVASSITAKMFYERNGFIKNGEPLVIHGITTDFPLIKRVNT